MDLNEPTAKAASGTVRNPQPPDATLLDAIAARRGDQAFMKRLRERINEDKPLLDRMAAVRAQTWDLLADALAEIRYTRDEGPGDRFRLIRDDEHNYAVLYIFTHNPNTYRPEEIRHTRHEFVVPVATYNKLTWRRWVFDRIVSIELHETCESFQIQQVAAPDDVEPDEHECGDCRHPSSRHDGRDSSCKDCDGPNNRYRHRFVPTKFVMGRPYAPHHGNGWDPYAIWYDGHPDEQAKAPGED